MDLSIGLLKNSRNRKFTRAAQSRPLVIVRSCRAVTVRGRCPIAFFSKLLVT
jgi:hypothetical protein